MNYDDGRLGDSMHGAHYLNESINLIVAKYLRCSECNAAIKKLEKDETVNPGSRTTVSYLCGATRVIWLTAKGEDQSWGTVSHHANICLTRQAYALKKANEQLRNERTAELETAAARKLREIDSIVHTDDEEILQQ